jgi:hypothetical protein
MVFRRRQRGIHAEFPHRRQRSDGVRIAFEIVSYKFTKTVVTVHWLSGKKAKVFTQFGEFSADGRGMVQFKSESGPRREFHRC